MASHPSLPKGAHLTWHLTTVETIGVQQTHCCLKDNNLRYILALCFNPLQANIWTQILLWTETWTINTRNIYAPMFFISVSACAPFPVTAEIKTFNRQRLSNLLLFNFVELVWNVVIFLADRRGTECGLQLNNSVFFNYWLVSCSDKVFWYLCCKPCLFKLCLLFYNLKPVWTLSCDINKYFCLNNCCSQNIFSL